MNNSFSHPIAHDFERVKSLIKKVHGIPETSSPQLRNIKSQTKPWNSLKNRLTLGPKTRIVISGIPRSGTGFIKELIASYPSSFTKGEIFSPEKSASIGNYIKRANALADRRNTELFALKFLLFQSPEYKKDLSGLVQNGWKLIVTQRTNIGQQALSHYLATAQDRFHSLVSIPLDSPPLISVDLDLFKRVIELFQRANKTLIEDIKIWEDDALVLSFEDDIRPVSPAVNKVAQFLDVEVNSLKPLEQRTFSNNLSLVRNRDAVVKVVELGI